MTTTVEAFLTRELDIRFIDARTITNEARVSLGIHGYPSDDQQRTLQDEALRIFEDRPLAAKLAMRQMSSNLEKFKASSQSSSLSHQDKKWSSYEDDSSIPSNDDDAFLYHCREAARHYYDQILQKQQVGKKSPQSQWIEQIATGRSA